MRRLFVALALILALPAASAAPEVEAIYPPAGSAIPERLPTIILNVSSDVQAADITITLDGLLEFTAEEGAIQVQDGRATWTVPEIFQLRDGMHNLTAVAQTPEGTARVDWNFTVDPSAAQKGGGVAALTIVLYFAGALGGIVLAVGGYAAFLWRVKGYTWKKFLIRFPRAMRFVGLYVPLVIAAGGTTGALVFVSASDVHIRFIHEYILLAGIVLGTLPFTIQTLSGRGHRRTSEKAFAQFLFEMADAMRGGIDPVKAIRELGSNAAGPLRKPLKRASENLRVGRPLDEVLQVFADQTRSPLIGRYTGLVSEAAAAGGDISMVVYQAAKDMDELAKIDAERAAAMRGPVMTMYIAFGVLFMITTTLVDFAPKLAEIDITSLGAGVAGGEEGFEGATGPAIDLHLMTQRFFHLLLIASMGTGLLVGAFTEGSIRYGLHHMMLMAVLAGIGFPIVAL